MTEGELEQEDIDEYFQNENHEMTEYPDVIDEKQLK